MNMLINRVKECLCLILQRKKGFFLFENDPSIAVNNEVDPTGDRKQPVVRTKNFRDPPVFIREQGEILEVLLRNKLPV